MSDNPELALSVLKNDFSQKDIEELKKQAANGNKGAAIILAEMKEGVEVQNIIADELIAPVAELVPVIAVTGAVVEGIANGTIVATVIEKVALKKLERVLGPIGDKVVEYGGKAYVKVKGVVVEVSKDSLDKVKNYTPNNTMRSGHIGIKENSDNAVKKFEVNNEGKMHLSNRNENVLDIVKDIGYNKNNLEKIKIILTNSLEARRNEKRKLGNLFDDGHKKRIKVEQEALDLTIARLKEV